MSVVAVRDTSAAALGHLWTQLSREATWVEYSNKGDANEEQGATNPQEFCDLVWIRQLAALQHLNNIKTRGK